MSKNHTNSGILSASAPTPYQNPQVSLEEGAEHTEQIREQMRQQIKVFHYSQSVFKNSLILATLCSYRNSLNLPDGIFPFLLPLKLSSGSDWKKPEKEEGPMCSWAPKT